MENRIVWFEIPVQDLERAASFYSGLLGHELQYMEHGPSQCYMFPFAPGVASGALMKSPSHTASQDGSLLYLNAGKDLSGPLNRVEQLGGKVIQDKTAIGENGFIAYFQDTEGNKIGLHSPD